MEVKDQGEKVIRTSCMIACGIACGILAHVKDGVLTKVEPADFPEPVHRHACARCMLTPKLVYHPDRLKYPMKRVGERGEGKWQRISWDEALDTIASRLKDIAQRYGPEAFVTMWVGLAFPNGAFFTGQRLVSAFGGTNVGLIMAGTSGGVINGTLGYGRQFVDYCWDQEMEDLRMAVLWGENMLDTNDHKYGRIRDARGKGGKMVVIGPIFNSTAAKADQWIPIRPGTDSALALGMINVILSEGLCDEPFVTEKTVGPFLVQSHNGLLLREKHISSGDSTTKYMIWDTKTNKPQTYDTPGIAPALRGSYTVDGIECKTALQLLAELAGRYSLERTSEITGIAPDVIKRLAVDYATRKFVATYKGLGLQRTYYGDLTYRAIDTLAAVTGNIVSKQWVNIFGLLDFASIMFPEMRFFKPLPLYEFWEAALTGNPYPVKALWISSHNPMNSHSDRNKVRKVMNSMEFIVSVELFMTSTAEYADIVLPGCTGYESDNMAIPWGTYVGGPPYFQMQPKVIEPYYECKPDLEIYNELAKRLGLEEFFNKSPEEYMEMLLSTDDALANGITLEKIKEGPVKIPYAETLFDTPSGRIEFYVEKMKEFGQELPVFIEPRESARQPVAKKYSLSLMQMHSKFRHHSILTNLDWMREQEPEPYVDINPVDAEKRGIHDGDMVTIFNDRGNAKLKARFNEGMMPGLVCIGEGWWAKDFKKGHYQELTGSDVNPAQVHAFEPSAQMQDIMVEVKKDEEG